MRNYTYDEWAAQERAADERRHRRQQYELLDPLELEASAEIREEDQPEPECECVQTDVDAWDARDCPAHGPRSERARAARQHEADAEFAYWSSPGWEEVFAEWEVARKPVRNAQVGEPRRTIVNAVGGLK